MSLWSSLLDTVFPPRCPGCGGEGADWFCGDCLAGTPMPVAPLCETCGLPLPPASPAERCRACLDHPPAFGRARACASYHAHDGGSAPLRAALHRYKYAHDLSEAGPLARLLMERCPFDVAAYDLLVPVPLHLSRLRWRGFNQAQLLARPLARRARRPLDPFALERRRATQAQVRLDLEGRRSNVRGAFAVVHPRRVENRRILLVDDVYTSGATADACARALRGARAAAVDVLALAHAVVS